MIRQLFLTHPHSVDESYAQHAVFAAGFSGRLCLAAAAAMIHAVLPFMFEKTASRMVADLYARTHRRGEGPDR